MGILEGDERGKHCNSNQKNSNADSYDAATQQFDSQFSPGIFSGVLVVVY